MNTFQSQPTVMIGLDMYVLSFIILAAVALLAIVMVTSFWMVKQKQLKSRLQSLSVEVSRANKEAKSANMAKDVFLHNVSHQIRTPLHAINGFAQLLSAPEYNFSDSDKAEFAGHIRSNTTILMKLFDDILSVVDIECGRFEMNVTTCKVNDLVRECMDMLRHMVNNSVELTFDSAVSDDFTIQSDAGRLQQILINVLMNAMSHTERGFIRIDVALDSDGERITFSVTDSGDGIPKEMIKDLFSKFRQVSKFNLGSGIGLSLCRTIAERLHGIFYLDTTYPNEASASSHGAKFICALPVAQP